MREKLQVKIHFLTKKEEQLHVEQENTTLHTVKQKRNRTTVAANTNRFYMTWQYNVVLSEK